jgi:hypothetical protein
MPGYGIGTVEKWVCTNIRKIELNLNEHLIISFKIFTNIVMHFQKLEESAVDWSPKLTNQFRFIVPLV